MRWKLPVFVALVTVSAVCATGAVGAERIVYPQAVVGPFESETYEIELFLGNKNEDEAWNGVIHLLRSDDLTGFSSINVVDENGAETVVSSGQIDVSIPKSSSRFYRMSSSTFQAGVLVIEALSSALDDLVPSFYYKLLGQGGTVIDIIGIEGVREPATGFRVMITNTDTSNVGIALVAEKALQQGAGLAVLDEVPVTFTAIFIDGSEASGILILGGSNSGQRALFPFQVIQGLQTGLRVAQLTLRSPEKLYVVTLGFVAPPESQNPQFSANPARIDIDIPVTNLSVDTQKRQAVIDFYNAIYMASEAVASGFTGDVSACVPGTTSAAFKLAILRRINFFRAMAGLLANIVLDDVFNQKCHAAALIMAAQRSLSHMPPTSWACYTADGAEAAEKSNLHLAINIPPGADMIDGYIRDTGVFNAGVGHRRWILFGRQTTMGTGTASDPTTTANCLWVIGPTSGGPDRNHSWPPAGFVPYQIV